MDSTYGLVLAGGRALRLHGEKALRRVRGQTLLEHAIGVLRPLCSRIGVSTGERAFSLPAGVDSLPDLAPYAMQGPLSGIHAGLTTAKDAGAERMLVLACDLPNVTTPLLALLLGELANHDVVFCEHAGLPEPLVCALRVVPMLKAVASALEAGELRVVPLWKAARCRLLCDTELAAFSPLERTFANVNTPADIERENA